MILMTPRNSRTGGEAEVGEVVEATEAEAGAEVDEVEREGAGDAGEVAGREVTRVAAGTKTSRTNSMRSQLKMSRLHRKWKQTKS